MTFASPSLISLLPKVEAFQIPRIDFSRFHFKRLSTALGGNSSPSRLNDVLYSGTLPTAVFLGVHLTLTSYSLCFPVTIRIARASWSPFGSKLLRIIEECPLLPMRRPTGQLRLNTSLQHDSFWYLFQRRRMTDLS